MENTNYDIVIVGGGIAGLVAAKELLNANKKVVIIEGRRRLGGRIKTLVYQFLQPVDAGAEFVHGHLPLTERLLKKAGSNTIKLKGKIYKKENGVFKPVKNFIENYKEVFSELKGLQNDIPILEFLEQHFNEKKNQTTKRSVIKMVEGFDAADPARMSSFAVRDELQDGSITESHLVKNGYVEIIKLLYDECIEKGCKIILSNTVKAINWKKGIVKIRCGEQNYIEAQKAIITVPLGILTSDESEENHIQFIPPVKEKIEAAKQIGYGSVVKGIFQFKNTFWDDKAFKQKALQMPKLGFIITDHVFQTWWTQSPELPILTGWAGGPNANYLKEFTYDEIFKRAISILADVFSTTTEFIEEQLVTSKIVNWGTDPFARGAYSYEMPGSKAAKKILLEPVEETLFFCGEALEENESSGTVEAAILNAEQVVKKILTH